MSLKRIAGTPWTPEQDAVLCEMFMAGKNDHDIGDVFGCTNQAVEARRRHLGLKKRHGGQFCEEPKRREPKTPTRVWTAEEDAIVIATNFDFQAIRKLLPHRPEGGLKRRIVALRSAFKRQGTRWSNAEIRILEANPYLSDNELTQLLPGRSVGSVYAMRSKLGIIHRRPPAETGRQEGEVFETSGIAAIRRKGVSVPYIPSLYGPGAMITC